MPQVGAGVAQPARLAGVTEQGLHHRERDQLSVADLRRDPDLRAPGRPIGRGLQQIVGAHVQCRREGVQVSVHESLLLIWVSTLILGTLHQLQRTPRRADPLESVI